MQDIKIRLASERVNPSLTFGEEGAPQLFTPGETITDNQRVMRLANFCPLYCLYIWMEIYLRFQSPGGGERSNNKLFFTLFLTVAMVLTWMKTTRMS